MMGPGRPPNITIATTKDGRQTFTLPKRSSSQSPVNCSYPLAAASPVRGAGGVSPPPYSHIVTPVARDMASGHITGPLEANTNQSDDCNKLNLLTDYNHQCGAGHSVAPPSASADETSPSYGNQKSEPPSYEMVVNGEAGASTPLTAAHSDGSNKQTDGGGGSTSCCPSCQQSL